MRNGKLAPILSLLAGCIAAFAIWFSGLIPKSESNSPPQSAPTSSVAAPTISSVPKGLRLESRLGQLHVIDVVGDARSLGLMPEDVIAAVDGVPVSTEDELMARFRQKRSGGTIKLRVRRGVVDLELQLEIAGSPSFRSPAGDDLGPGLPASDPLGLSPEAVATTSPKFMTDDDQDPVPADDNASARDPDRAEFGLVLKEEKGRVSVMEVTPRRASEVAGVEAGDILFQIDSDKLTSIQDFDTAVANKKKGDAVSLLLIRGENIVIIEQMLLGGFGQDMPSRNGVTARIFPIASLRKESIRQLLKNPLDLKAEITRNASLDFGNDKSTSGGESPDASELPDDVAEFMATDIPHAEIAEPELLPILSDGASRLRPSVRSDADSAESEPSGQASDAVLTAPKLNELSGPRLDDAGNSSDSAWGTPSQSGTGAQNASRLPLPKTPPPIASPILSPPSPPADTELKLGGPLVNEIPPGLSSDRTMTRLTQIDTEELPSPAGRVPAPTSSEPGSRTVLDQSRAGGINSILVPQQTLPSPRIPQTAAGQSAGQSAGSGPFYPGPITEVEPLVDAPVQTPIPWSQDDRTDAYRELSPTMSDYSPDFVEGSEWGFQDPYCQGCGNFGPCRCTNTCKSFSLNRLLWNRDDTPVTVGGWVSGGYHSESNDLFNNRPDRFGIHQGWLYLEKSAEKRHGWGFRADVVYGIDAQDTQAFGNRPGVWDFRNGLDFGAYGWAVPQLYGELEVADWNVKLGRFYTLIGYESVMAPDNFFYSHSITMYNSEPFTHTGVLASREIGNYGTVYAGWTAGWDTGFDQFKNSGSWLGGIGYELATNLNVNYISTVGNFGARGDSAYSHSIVIDLALNDCLSWVVQNDYLRVGSTGEDNIGLNQYLFYELTDKVAVGARMEWWKGEVQTGYAPHDAVLPKKGSLSYYAATLGVNYRPCCNFMCRPEVRHDWSPAAGYAVTYFGIDAVVTY